MTTPTPINTAAIEKLPYVLTSRAQVALALRILGRKKPDGPFKLGDVMRLRAFIRWAIASGCFTSGAAIDTFSIIDRAEFENEEWKTDEDAGEDVVRVAGVLEGLTWADYKTMKQAVVVWP